MTTIVDTPDELAGVFAELSEQFNGIDYSEPLTAFQQILAEGHREAFSSGVSPGGEAWQALAQSTVRKKGHSQILVETGALGLSLTSVGGPGNISEVMERGSVFGTMDEKSVFHTFGVESRSLPKREHVGTNEAGVDRLATLIADHAIESVKE